MSLDLLTRAARNLRPRNAVSNPVVGRMSMNGQGVPANPGVGDQLDGLRKASTLFGVVTTIAKSVATVDWHLYRGDDPSTLGPVEDRQEVMSHPALVVWNRPNPFFTQRKFVQTIQQHRDLTGEFCWINAGTGTTPLNIWSVRPDRIKPVPDPRTFISGYTYRVGSVDIPLKVEDVVHQFDPNPADPYRGISPLGSLASDLSAESAAARWNAVFFENSARVDGVLETPDVLPDPEFERMVKHWQEQHQGISNAHRIAVMEGGTFKPTGYSQKDMDFVSLRNFTKEQILEAYAFPKFMLGKIEGVNRSVGWASIALYTKICIVPRLDAIREALNTAFLPLFGTSGRGVCFDYSDPIPSDPEDERADLRTRLRAVQVLAAVGGDPSELCEAFGLPEVTFREMTAPVPSTPTGPGEDPDDTEQGDDTP